MSNFCPSVKAIRKAGSSEIWSDKLKVLCNRHMESRRERR